MNNLYRMGVSVSYDRVLEIEVLLPLLSAKGLKKENLVCPANLRHCLVTVGALDNIDYNSTSTTAQGSFHRTGINIFQLPSHSNSGIVRNPIIIEGAPLKKLSLPGEYVMFLLYLAKLTSCQCNNFPLVMKVLVFLMQARLGKMV